jgi:riboflavin synthase
MFTGIVTDVGRVTAVTDQDRLRRLRIECAYDPAGIALGASIACSGPCLTVVAVGEREGGAWFEVDAAAETLALTTVRDWREGTRVNLERSLRIGDELGGHIVTGHVDGRAEIVARTQITEGEGARGGEEPWGATARFDIRAPRVLAPFIAQKGSVCLDGTSLTVNDVANDVFSVLLIPHTLSVTTWGERQAGDFLNLEIDLMARYAARLSDARSALGRGQDAP